MNPIPTARPASSIEDGFAAHGHEPARVRPAHHRAGAQARACLQETHATLVRAFPHTGGATVRETATLEFLTV
jgi:hypothetical protein